MKRSVKPSTVNGSIAAPPSKSVAQRAIAIASMAKGISEIIAPGNSDDVKAAISVCRAFGAMIDEQYDRLTISGGLSLPKVPLNCGESGLGIRMFSAIASTLDGDVVLTGKGSLLKRPMEFVAESLGQMGVKCETTNGLLPIIVKGPLLGGVARINGSISSQVLTGILLASPYAQKDVVVQVDNLQSRPYIDVTLEIMKCFGVEVANKGYDEFIIKSGQKYQPRTYTVEGDWSGAAFLLTAGAIAGRVKVDNLRVSSPQADKAIINALNYAGAKVSVYDNYVEVSKHQLNAFDFDATHCPDLFPPLVALASLCDGTSKILGVNRLQAKESNRAATLIEEFGKLGINITADSDLMVIQGGRPKAGAVKSHNDHRIAMAAAVAALAGEGIVEIEGAEAVAKSYPDFFEDFNDLISK